ncbi:type III-A CRISPR-associated RAMP protein Csm5 [Flavihumibacter profundi]|uniref:type III-A CRISPR-associated RAMP protein Csm5 n=1 Tax=Flavihumibacter profundi TaxID=2716883 RepID=UPI001CC59014|nr:type III-A CRISPR-associated RAMP protein Csm5 [Flavihumibacter profundi]MBZ5857564.1 type III-A CRISPR-associated RAMP protein Csm5 [Flavihumibacter profundi]
MTHQVELEVLTPVHVGMGTEKTLIKGLDFIYKGRNFYVFNSGKILEQLEQKDLASVSSFLSGGDFDGFTTFLERKRLLEGASILYSSYSEYGNTNEVRTTFRNGAGKYLIPGSSIKGVIRGILASHLWEGRTADIQLNTLMGNIDNNLMRFLQVTDCMIDTQPMIFPVKIFSADHDRGSRENYGAWKHNRNGGHAENFSQDGFVTYFEMLPDEMSGHATKGSFRINWGGAEYIRRNNNSVPNINLFEEVGGVNWLIKTIKKHSANFLERELDFFEAYRNERLDDSFFQELEWLLEQNEADENSCIIRIGGNVGWHSITGDWKFSDSHINAVEIHRGRGPVEYKTRKLGFQKDDIGLRFFLPGYVKLKVI